ncbi:MAG: phosphoenolpyruvate--protein phosphotransferase [Planctomycetota bacterium]|jgi:phosphotransferase system enzyme I (PtsI)
MEVRQGVPGSPGVASAPAFLLEGEDLCIPERRVDADAVDAEVSRLEKALGDAAADLESLRERVADHEGGTPEVDAVLDAHAMILRDPALVGGASKAIRENRFSAEWAISSILEEHAQRMRAIGDEYLMQRVADLRDIRGRVLRVLLGEREEELARLKGRVILVARDLTPSQTASLDREKVAGFVTGEGGPTSHTAIIARSLVIPAVVGAGDVTAAVAPGMALVVDGSRGQIILQPDSATKRRYREIHRHFLEHRTEVERVRDLPAETLDGHRIHILANVEFPQEIPSAMEAGAEGIGLYRTEFLVRPGVPLPTEEEHLRAYREALDMVNGRPLTLRTLDLGADKVNPDPEAASEANPFLGRRSLRLCLSRPDLFEPQVRAILRASVHGDLRVLLPMVASVGEFLQAREVFDTQRERLRREGIRTPPDLPIGAMIEVPSAAMSADVLAGHASFLSVGTNDLIQYTLAVDRVNPRVAHLYEPTHPAILRLITRVIRAGRARDLPVSLCGEMSGEPLYAYLLLGFGFRTLSMNPRSVPEVKQVIRAGTMEAAWSVAKEVRGLRDGAEIQDYLRARMREIVPVLF